MYKRQDDSDVIKLLKFLTFLTKEEIEDLEKKTKEEPHKRLAQKALADSVCNLIHGEAATQTAIKSAEVLFGAPIDGLSSEELEAIFADVPSSEITRDKLASSSFIETMVEIKAIKSKGEGRRLVQNGGAYLNNVRVSEVDYSMADSPVADKDIFIIRTGKKSYFLVKIK